MISYKCNVTPQGLNDGKNPTCHNLKGMTKQFNNQTLIVGFAHYLKCARYKSQRKLKRMLVNDHAIFLKYFPKNDLCLFWPTPQKGGHMLRSLRGKNFARISNVVRNGGAPNCLHMLHPIKICKNPTKTWKL
jgi:hypothetical protein